MILGIELNGITDKVRVYIVMTNVNMKRSLKQTIVVTFLFLLCCLIPAKAQLTGKVNVDNTFEAYISTDNGVQGTFIGSGTSWWTTYSLASSLTTGQDYYLHVKALDAGGVAGFLGDFEITGSDHTFSNGLTTLNTNTTDWVSSTTGWSNYQSVSDYGVNGVSPWGDRSAVNDSATWIWSSDSDADNANYFSTRIVATAILPIVDYRFDECNYTEIAGEIIDQSGNFNATSIGLTSPVDDSIINKSLDLRENSTSDWVYVPSGSVDGLDDFTVSLWFKTGVSKNQQEIFHALGDNNGDDELEIYLKNDDRVYIKVRDNEQRLDSNITLTDDNWHHLVITRMGQDVCLFIDGAEQECDDGVNDGVLSVTNPNAVVIGQEQDQFGGDFSTNQNFEGLLDEFKIFGKKIADVQIYNMYQNELAGNNYDASLRDSVQCNLTLAGRVTLNNTAQVPEFTSVCFDTPFSEVPRVFSLPTTASDSDRLALRIRNVTETGFEIAQVESEEEANPSVPAGNVSQTIDFLAIVEGDYTLNGGANMRVSSLNTQAFQAKRVSGSFWETVSTADLTFSQSPAIIASIQTMNNETTAFPISTPFLATAISNVTNTQFRIALERAETDSGTLNANENIAYIAITPGITGQLTPDISYESFRTNDDITGIDSCRVFDLSGDYSNDAPIVIASQNTRDGADGGWLKRCSISSSSVGFSIVEDMDNDTDTGHTSEQAGGIALGGTFTNQTCSVQPSYVHHYEIAHDGEGLTCDTEVVTVNACENASCSTLSSQLVTLDFLANGSVISSLAFTGSTAVNVNNTDVETISFSLANTSITASNPVECDDSSGSSCDMAFTDAGFRFLSGAGNETTLPNQTSGSMFGDTLKIQAVKDTNGVCTSLFTGNKDVNLSQENVDPGGDSGLSFSVDGSTIAKHSSGITSTTLDFGSLGIATIPAPIYNDAGQIRLRASYNVDGVSLTGSSNSFWVSPAKFVVTAKSGATDLNGATATATTTFAAGDDFNLTVMAYNAASPAVITPNYSPGQIQLMLTRTGPSLSDSTDGDLTYASGNALASSTSPIFQNVTLSNFALGVSTYSAAQYSEVGLLNLDVQDSNYGNANIVVPASEINIGRFIPKYFTQTVADDGAFFVTCNSPTGFAAAAYSGQMDEVTSSAGPISYLTSPVLAITAHNSQGGTTQNYYQDSQGSGNDYMKLTNSDIMVNAPTFDQVAIGVDSNQLPLTANMNTGVLSQYNMTATSSGNVLPRGVLHYQLSAADNFFYQRSANALVAPFISAIDFSIATIIDTDNVPVNRNALVNQIPIAASPNGVEIRFGRLLLENSFGPETSNFPQSMQIEHFDGTTFVGSSDENCASYDVGKLSLTTISLDISLTSIGIDLGLGLGVDFGLGSGSIPGGTGYFLDGKTQAIVLQTPGLGNQGEIGVSYDAYDWFKYDWDNDGVYDNLPSAIATFGIFRGNDRVVNWREVSSD